MLYGYEDGGFGIPDDDEPDFDYPQTPAPESEDGDDYGYVYDNDYPQSPAPESDGGGDYGYVYDNDYPQSPAPESDGGDYGYIYDNDYPQSPESSPAPATGDGSDYDSDSDSGDIPDNYLSLEADYCPDVVEGISTCQDFLNGHEDSPSSACCDRLYDLSFIGVEPPPPSPESEDGGDCSYASAADIPPPPSSPVDCPGVVERLSPCQEYLNGHNDLPSPPCCDNLEAMGFIISVNVCECVKDMQDSFKQSRANDIFNKCGFSLPYFAMSRKTCGF
nr:non-specific lipid-transfer protein 13 [Ipomoea batatas]GMD36805.1 non-specific lipid-transfer protein 13 [Ipomoea batatas]